MIKDYNINQEPITIKRALLSVYDKTEIKELALNLAKHNIEIISTGGTAKLLKKENIAVIEIEEYTNFPEIMDGRVKTINPIVEGGILALRDVHMSDMKKNNIGQIDLVICNLYPFDSVIKNSDHTLSEAFENIDIGGPTMIRSAAKNIGWVAVATHPKDYQLIMDELDDQGSISYKTREHLAKKAFLTTSVYESSISNYLCDNEPQDQFTMVFDKFSDLRYGENPHQTASAYHLKGDNSNNILNAKQHQGKQLSYNNIMDADAALCCLREFNQTACVIVKHANPCGVSIGDDLVETYQNAFKADSVSAFGGIVAINRKCTEELAKILKDIFIEIVVAPSFEKEALKILSTKKNLRLLEVQDIENQDRKYEMRNLDGGILVQQENNDILKIDELKVVTNTKPTEDTIKSMLFGWQVLKHVKSNAIITVKDNTTVGIGAGQVSRIDAVDIAISKSKAAIKGSILCSDAFFPFRDSIDKISQYNINGVIQPGGSIKDNEVIDACNEHNIPMVFTGRRCFKH